MNGKLNSLDKVAAMSAGIEMETVKACSWTLAEWCKNYWFGHPRRCNWGGKDQFRCLHPWKWYSGECYRSSGG